MSNKNFKHEALTFMHLLRFNAIERCETDAERIEFFYDFAEAIGMNFSKHFEDTKAQYGQQIADHMVLSFVETACAVNPDFAKTIKGIVDRCFGGVVEKQEYLN
ncbi:MAG: hypothetical protein GOVbin406_36 [Prokaryotic dsDNA virus sp.]|nr:MAG: hypothetical protein GOVbin406_36 [Prokaryotic dsDNA virus sp.]|tara:strand:+ start:6952 stop:7263 length:312 start_codon:yes stop_codon:yes gene_type:complete